MFDTAEFDAHEAVNFVTDADSGLRAIVAVHSTRRGPAIGGCRVWNYANAGEALRDALRLSRGMTYKAAMAGVPFGGGKAAVMIEPARPKTPAMMRALGRAIARMAGSYVTGEDVGTTCADMVAIHTATAHVMGLPVEQGGSGDPSPNTALGCFEGIRASVRHALGKDDLRDVRVAIQGAGNVGCQLCALLASAGAQLTVADVDRNRAQRCAEKFGARIVDPPQLIEVEADVLAPCALGGILNADTIPQLRVRIVAGGANNQLESTACGAALRDRRILYAPDYVINAGGMIQLAAELTGMAGAEVGERVRAIGATLLRVYRFAAERGVPTNAAADLLASQILIEAR
ncbi:MAG: Glu/Leu/Phe/Val family dehydrogenase, partial [Steroidobacteraceae bacterium]